MDLNRSRVHTHHLTEKQIEAALLELRKLFSFFYFNVKDFTKIISTVHSVWRQGIEGGAPKGVRARYALEAQTSETQTKRWHVSNNPITSL